MDLRACAASPQDEKRQKGFALLRTEAAACLRQLAPLLGGGPATGEMRPSLIRLLLADLRGGGAGTPSGSCSGVGKTAVKSAADGVAPKPCSPAGRPVTPSMSGMQVKPCRPAVLAVLPGLHAPAYRNPPTLRTMPMTMVQATGCGAWVRGSPAAYLPLYCITILGLS